MIKLNQTYQEMGKSSFNLINNLSKIRFTPQINLTYGKKAGIILPYIDYELLQKKQLPAYSFEDTSHSLDELIIILEIFFKKLVFLAEKEDIMLKFAFNFKKINRRINGLKNIIIPNLQLKIKKIKNILEEIEREEYVRLKITKDSIFKKKAVEALEK